MVLFEWTLWLLLGAVVVSRLSARLQVPYPVFLALGGAAISFVPGAPHVALEPDLALAIFVAPVLLDAAFDTSVRDLRENALPVAGLVLAAVGVTTAAVAYVAHAMVPGLPWAAAIALGAIVAPPDAAAATAILRSVAPPHRVVVILEGESLLNDASALLIYRIAVGAAAAGFSLASAAPTFLVVVAGSIVAALVLSRLFAFLTRDLTDPPSAIILQFVTTFGVWILAERLGLSPILTIVVYAMAIARRAPRRMGAAVRVPAYAVWETAVFLLNVLAFVLVGLQIGPILERLGPGQRSDYVLVAGVILATVILARIVWVMAYNSTVRLKNRLFGVNLPRPMMAPTFGTGAVVAWSGMRGIVTLAAALALPNGFPYRDLIVLAAFTVVLGTLVIQGLTLRPLLRLLDIHDDAPVEREVRLARVETARAGLKTLEGDESDAARELRRELLTICEGARQAEAGDGQTPTTQRDLRRQIVEAGRRRLIELRESAAIGDDAYHRLEAEFDFAELESTR